MNGIDPAIAHLQNPPPLTEGNVEDFLELVASATVTGDPRAVKPVLMLVDDNCELEGVMERMLALLEAVPVDSFVPELLEALPEFNAKSPSYAQDEITKLLWSEADRAVLRAGAARSTGNTAFALRDVLGRIGTAALAAPVQDVMSALEAGREANENGSRGVVRPAVDRDP